MARNYGWDWHDGARKVRLVVWSRSTVGGTASP